MQYRIGMPKTAQTRTRRGPLQGMRMPPKPVRNGPKHGSPKHALVKWRRDRGLGALRFIELMQPHLPKNYPLTASTLSRIENGQVKVRLEFVAAASKVTNGAVGLNDFMG